MFPAAIANVNINHPPCRAWKHLRRWQGPRGKGDGVVVRSLKTRKVFNELAGRRTPFLRDLITGLSEQGELI